jgi:hypothetical protein
MRLDATLTESEKLTESCSDCQGTGHVWILCGEAGVIRDRCRCPKGSGVPGPALQGTMASLALAVCFLVTVSLLYTL